MKRLASMLVALLCAGCPMPMTPTDGGMTGVDAGCPSGTLQAVGGRCVEVGARCGEGFQRDDSGFGCVPVLATCGDGQLAVPGSACADIGWTNCPAGFTDDGWSCAPVLPTTTCTGATRAALGNDVCSPIGDCNAPFPPSAATYFVDASATPDATHFATITAALAAAPAGATVAISPGTYRESVTVPRGVKLVGKCAAQVTLIGSPAVFVDGVSNVELSGVTLRDSLLALRVERGGKVLLQNAVLEHNERSAVQVLDVNTEVTLRDVVIRDTQPDSTTASFGQGIGASFGAAITLDDVELTNNFETGVFLDREATKGTLNRVLVSNTKPRASTGKLGWGIGVQRGATLTATNTVVERNTTAGIAVASAPSVMTLRDVLVRETRVGLDNAGVQTALGVSVSAGAVGTWTGGASQNAAGMLIHVAGDLSSLTVEDVTAQQGLAMNGVITAGVTVEDGAQATLRRIAVRGAVDSAIRSLGSTTHLERAGLYDTKGSGLVVQGGALDGTDLFISGHDDVGARVQDLGTLTLSKCVVERGRIDHAYGLGAQNGILVVDSCALRDSATAGVYVTQQAVAQLTHVTIDGVRLDAAGEFGQGVIAETGANITLGDVSITGAHSAGLNSADGNTLVTADHVLVRGTLRNGTGTRGRGANANFLGGLFTTSTLFLDNQQVGVFAFQSRVDLVDTFVKGVKTDPGLAYGNGIEALTDGLIVMRGGGLSECEGIAAVFAEASGSMDAVRVFDNEIGLHAQDGSTVEELTSVPQELGVRQVVVSTSTVFENNRAKLSGSTVPVPSP
ncbi:MAG: right-handed parallel beta-helix repeat-containing protein [Archangium sp.]